MWLGTDLKKLFSIKSIDKTKLFELNMSRKMTTLLIVKLKY